MNWILTYLMVGVATVWLYDYTAEKLESNNHFTNRERVIVALIWPIAVMMLIWAIIKTFVDDSN